ncbi:HAD-IA family hydrolase [Alteromonas sp. ASW11-36]|uniref:HAD-IA family hydrolase n=1 Tax=Alteromonas arenosi TaxID=3055817 RepID=A0ABT7SSL0_9ALTE|nr:HAD-IA family hydrolase [Alteromonas sp. ASW11-36]MDM7859171.1 HAD-IA family hydrolase [Alteromonas sp. ASW11-36]
MLVFRQLQRPQAITFDLDDTLYDNGPIIRRATAKLQDYITTEHPAIAALVPSQWNPCRKAAIRQDPRLSSDMTRLRKAVLRRLGELAGYSAEQCEQLAESGYQVFYQARSDFSINENVYSLLSELVKHMPIVAITNGNVDLQQVGIGHLFSACYQANIHAPMKPSPVMFDRALVELGLPAERVLHVGDHLVKDVWAAHQVGMQSAWFACNREMNLRNEPCRILPTVQLCALNDLLKLVG